MGGGGPTKTSQKAKAKANQLRQSAKGAHAAAASYREQGKYFRARAIDESASRAEADADVWDIVADATEKAGD